MTNEVTPTNDAPVTVEPAAELAEMLLVGTETGAFDHTPEEIGLHVMENAQAILNALASAPAGDGVEENAALLADGNSWYSSVQLEEIAREVERRECKIADDMSRHDDWHKHRHAEYVAAEIAEGIAAALARPRAAVGEREA